MKEMLTRAAYISPEKDRQTFTITKCKNKCVTCTHLVETSEVIINQQKFQLKYNFSCDSKNLIYMYVIICECKLNFYIGECLSLKQRDLLHRSNINWERNRVLKVSKHIFQCSGGKFTIYPFYKMKNDCEIQRKAKEKYFIEKFQPNLNGDI